MIKGSWCLQPSLCSWIPTSFFDMSRIMRWAWVKHLDILTRVGCPLVPMHFFFSSFDLCGVKIFDDEALSLSLEGCYMPTDGFFPFLATIGFVQLDDTLELSIVHCSPIWYELMAVSFAYIRVVFCDFSFVELGPCLWR